MAFNSLQFLAFFPVVVAIHFILPHRIRWAWLLLASLYFYGVWQPLLLLDLLGAAALSYYFGLRIEDAPEKLKKKSVMKLGVWLLVANLFVFKYTVFVNDSFRSLFESLGASYPIPAVQLLLPIGISFYTFQLISYLVDVSNGTKAERHLGVFALYVSFFPKLVAGPIERAKNLIPQLHAVQSFDYARIVSGLELVAWGVFKKVVVADRLAPFVNRVYEDPHSFDGVSMVLATLAFAFQIYCDFSGYTDIAIGCALIMGFRLMENFNRPYFAISIQDFWKRWHISLTSWLTDYVYTPLSRSRAFKLKLYYQILLSLFLTFLLSGLWHGAQWTFVLWGALHGFYLIFATMTQKWRTKLVQLVKLDRVPKAHRALRIFNTFLLVCFAYILFQASSVGDAWHIMTHLHTGWTSPAGGIRDFLAGQWPEFVLGLGGILVVVLADILQEHGSIRERLASKPALVRWAVYYGCILSIVVLGAYYDTNQQFIYFQF